MKMLFRCVKIVIEEKAIFSIDKPKESEKCVQVTFDWAEASKFSPIAHGYIGLTLPLKEFQKLGYEVGGTYELGKAS